MMGNIDWKRKFASRKFWALLAALVVAVLAATGAEEFAERITAIISAVGSCVVYILAEAAVDKASAENTLTVEEIRKETLLDFEDDEEEVKKNG